MANFQASKKQNRGTRTLNAAIIPVCCAIVSVAVAVVVVVVVVVVIVVVVVVVVVQMS